MIAIRWPQWNRHCLPDATKLFPQAAQFDVVGYGCTSGTAVIGPEKINQLISANCNTKYVTEPLSALIAACQHLNLKNIAFLSPYIENVSNTLRTNLQKNGINSPVFGSFNEGEEAKVARIDKKSIIEAAIQLGKNENASAVFLSCTNLKTLDVIAEIEATISKARSLQQPSSRLAYLRSSRQSIYILDGPGKLLSRDN